jgi:hypothetical protein
MQGRGCGEQLWLLDIEGHGENFHSSDGSMGSDCQYCSQFASDVACLSGCSIFSNFEDSEVCQEIIWSRLDP